MPIEQKESYGWLENVKQAAALFTDPQRCVHIGDRESDIYELFCTAQRAGTHFLLRTCLDRLAGDGKHPIAEEMKEVRVQGRHRIQVRNKKGEVSTWDSHYDWYSKRGHVKRTRIRHFVCR